MTTVALQQALKWHEELMLHFRVRSILTKGRNPKDSAVRFDLSKESGVPTSYLVRLAHKASEMRSLDAEVYRLLHIAHSKYVSACERIEDAADAMRAERLELKAKREDAHHQSHWDMAQRAGAAADRTVAVQGEITQHTIGEDASRGQGSVRQ
jgi:hypothetical protein